MNQEPSTKNQAPAAGAAVFDAYAASYDLLYRDKDYAGEADYIDRLIKRFQPDAKSIVELGSGTGKHARLLAAKGYTVHGIERSEEMLAQAKKETADHRPQTIDLKKDHDEATSSTVYGLRSKVSPPSFSQGDVRTVRLGETFDAAISLFHVASYQTSNQDLADYFETARIHLEPGGLFIFDLWYGPAVLTDRPVVRVKRVEDEKVSLTRIAEPEWKANENVVMVNYHLFVREKASDQVKEIHETHAMRYLFMPELALIAAQQRFVIESAEEWMTGARPSSSTWGVCFIARAV